MLRNTAPHGHHAGLRPGWSRALRGAQTLVALVSVLVLAVSGYAWSAYRQLDSRLVTSDVVARGSAPDGATDILLVGLDSRTDAAGNPLPQQLFDALHVGPDEGELNTDTLVLIRVPNDPTRPTTAISIPRDSYVTIPGFGTHKINSAYVRAATEARAELSAQGVTGTALEQQSAQAGRRSLIATVEQLTGASVDHYAEVNLVGFAEITKAVGGVPVCLAAPIRDSYSGANFRAGPQTLSGAPALAFVRQRHGLPRGDLDRVVRQQAFLAGLTHKILSAGTLANPAQLSALITAVSHYIVVDPGFDLLGFASQARGLAGGNVSFRTIPVGSLALPTPQDGVAVEVDPTAVRAFVSGLTGTEPDPGPGTGTVSEASGSEASGSEASGASGTTAVTVDVRNATRRIGLAAGVMDLLDQRGFAPGEVANATPVAGSAVLAAPVSKSSAHQVATLLGGLPVRTTAAVPPGHVEVVLGRTYEGPSVPDTAAGSATTGSGTTGSGTSGAETTGSGTTGSGTSGAGTSLEGGSTTRTGSLTDAGSSLGAGAATADGSGATPTAVQPPAPPPITADGVRCVN